MITQLPLRPMSGEVARVRPLTPGTESLPVEELADVAIDALSRCLAGIDPIAGYVIPFSAGYDTRVLFCLLDGWTSPHLTLVTWAPEVEPAKEVYAAMGLEHEHIVHPGGEDYWLPILRDRAWLASCLVSPKKRTGGAYWLRDIAADYTLSALWADETLGWAQRGDTLDEFVASRMLGHSSPRPDVWPFASAPWIEMLCRYSLAGVKPEPADHGLTPLYSRSDTLKREMIRQLKPELLEIPNPRFAVAQRIRDGEELPHHCLSEAARDELQDLDPAHERPPCYLGDGCGEWIERYQRGVMEIHPPLKQVPRYAYRLIDCRQWVK